jgi:cell division protein FtsN
MDCSQWIEKHRKLESRLGIDFVQFEPSADRYYRVRVGPYADTESAHLAKRMLEKGGFQAIVKR